MKLNKARRLSVRIPTIGWEARISTNRLRITRAKIANVSADGAYLITQAQYQPESRITLSIESSEICFSVTGMVLRNDPYGVAVRFLDHSQATRSSLLRIISKYLSAKRPQASIAAGAPMRAEWQRKPDIDSEGECFYNGALMATAPCSEAPTLAERNGDRSADNSVAISMAENQSTGLLKAFLGNSGNTTVKCPWCNKSHYTTVPDHFHNKPVRVTCKCGKSFPVLFDSRKFYRKEVRFPGEYWDTLGGRDLMTVTTLSASGAGFEAGRRRPSIKSGETIQVKFLLENHSRLWIKTKAVVKRVKGNQVGIEFLGMDEHLRKCIGFYLML